MPLHTHYSYPELTAIYLLLIILLQTILLPQKSYGEETTANNRISLTYATINYPPWSYQENNQIKGINIEIVKRICDDIDVDVNIEIMPGKRIWQRIHGGSIDLSTTVLPYNKHLKNHQIVLEEELFFSFLMAATSLRKQKIIINTTSDLYDYHVGHIHVPINVENSILPKHPKRNRFHNIEAMIKSLFTHRIDVIYSSQSEAWSAATDMQVIERLNIKTLATSLSVRAFWSNKGIIGDHPELREKFNRSLRKLKKQGEIAEILKKHSKLDFFTDYGNPPLKKSIYKK